MGTEVAALRRIWLVVVSLVVGAALLACSSSEPEPKRPNILLVLSGDHSWAHTSRAGFAAVETPNFDRVAAEGVYFDNAHAAAASGTASRTAIATGRHIWQTESAALLWGEWPRGLPSYQDLLEQSGYYVGHTGVGWGPGFVAPDVRRDNPAGRGFVSRTPAGGVDLAASFRSFLIDRPAGAPFSFWIGSFEPHRPYEGDATRLAGRAGVVPGFLPDNPKVRRELGGYLSEIEGFDRDLGAVLAVLEREGLLEDTLVVVTAVAGMEFPVAKTQNYEYGVRVPLAARWGSQLPEPGRSVSDMVSLIDLAPTFLELAGVRAPAEMAGHSLLGILKSEQAGQVDPKRTAVFSAYERHTLDARPNDATYPRRAIHTPRYVYLRNYFPDRWPAGGPPLFVEAHVGLLREGVVGPFAEPFFTRATAKRPREELYDLVTDPFQLSNVADKPTLMLIQADLARRLDEELVRTRDPVHTGGGVDYFRRFQYHGPEASRSRPQAVSPP